MAKILKQALGEKARKVPSIALDRRKDCDNRNSLHRNASESAKSGSIVQISCIRFFTREICSRRRIRGRSWLAAEDGATVFASTSNRVRRSAWSPCASGGYERLSVCDGAHGCQEAGHPILPPQQRQTKAPRFAGAPNFNSQTLTPRSWPPCPQVRPSWRSLWVSPGVSSPWDHPQEVDLQKARSPGSRP